MRVQEELNIIVQTMQKQINLIQSYKTSLHEVTLDATSRSSANISFPALANTVDSATRLTDNLQVELNDIQALLDNTNSLVNRTVQLVNLRQEDHTIAVLVFTVVTIVFLPLNFVCSFFGMNVSDIRDMNSTQSLFWVVAACVTSVVVTASILVAFNGGAIMDRFMRWKERRRHAKRRTVTGEPPTPLDKSFHVLNADQGSDYSW